MICEDCEEKGHYWFAEDDKEISNGLTALIGIYADCDMRQVFDTRTDCECGCHKKAKKKTRWQLIAGYGQLGSWNWGFDETKIEPDKWLKELQKHIGERVLLTGGGSFGKHWYCTLANASIDLLGDKPTPKVTLKNLRPRMDKWSKEPNIFEPWLGSWQISVKV